MYQIVWLRKAFAAFGVVSPVLSIVLSTFMLGLSIGSWFGGRWGEKWRGFSGQSPLVLYGISELLIGVGAFVVPAFFILASHFLFSLGESNSTQYLILSAIFISISILPWCIFMGMTLPLMMAFIKELSGGPNQSFSFLYLANVVGAMVGTGLSTVIIIELYGFQNTLYLAAAINFSLAVFSFLLAGRIDPSNITVFTTIPEKTPVAQKENAHIYFLSVLFVTGFSSMALEVVWTRAFTPVLQTTIYAFAFLLVLYLLGTWIGSAVYRVHLRRGNPLSITTLVGFSFITCILVLPFNDPRTHFPLAGIVFSITPFCIVLGYLTPQLIDMYSQGTPSKAGRAYAINILGCILGPLFAGYIFLPLFGVKWSILVLTVPFFCLLLYAVARITVQKLMSTLYLLMGSVLCVLSALFVITYEEPSLYGRAEVRRDHTATVISTGSNLKKRLLVNGVGITIMTPITKIMAHLPLFSYDGSPKTAIVLCFGMGTSYRSLMSWGVDVTAVELVPSVIEAFGYYFDDASTLMARPNSHVIIDDARRYLQRVEKKYDIITIDPPPPAEAAGSSLLYSVEFYDLLKERLEKRGIVQQWCPTVSGNIPKAVARSLSTSFPHVVAFLSIENWGYHFLASMEPITLPTAKEALMRMPDKARHDLMEWYAGRSIDDVISNVLLRRVSLTELIGSDRSVLITDDRPYNEYYKVRRTLDQVSAWIN